MAVFELSIDQLFFKSEHQKWTFWCFKLHQALAYSNFPCKYGLLLPSPPDLMLLFLFVQSPYVEAPQFGGAYFSFNFPMPTAPPGAQRDPVP